MVVHNCKPHFWARIDAGSFVLCLKAEDSHCSPFFPTATVGQAGGKAAGCCLASESQEPAFTSTSQSCPPARGKAIFCVSQAVLWKDNGFDGLRVGMSLPQKLAGKHTGEGQCTGKG